MSHSKKWNTRHFRNWKASRPDQSIEMLTCYDFQTAQMFAETDVDLLLVGDSLGNVVLGYETTVEVTIEEMKLFGAAVKRGAPNKFTIVDMPFGSYINRELAVENAVQLFRSTKTEALKVEGAGEELLEAIKLMTENGIPVCGHIGLTPQSVHQMGGYFKHGKTPESMEALKTAAKRLEKAGCFMLVLECVEEKLAAEITHTLHIPTIGIGSGTETTGQVLVINDLLKLGKDTPPSFCHPVANLYQTKIDLVQEYLKKRKSGANRHPAQ